jgi:hypothetical protein
VELDMLMGDEENSTPNKDVALKRTLPYEIYKETGVDNNVMEYEAKKIMSKEEELLKKAKDLENEMLQIR